MNRHLFIAIVISFISMLNLSAQQVADSVLIIRSGTVTIPEYAYYERDDFHTVRFESPSTVAGIGNYAFRNCNRLRSVQLPESIKKIGTGAFAFCEQLVDLTLPTSLKDIGSQAFAYCMQLPELTFPKSVTHIGANAFSFCQTLQRVILPSNLRELESYAFSECTSLQSVTLPANSNMLGEMIFFGCSSLEEIIEPSSTPPIFDCNSQPFDLEEDDCFTGCLLKVPAKSINKYKSAKGWNLFHNIVPITQ